MDKRFELSIQHLWAATVLVGIFIFVSTHPIRPQDFWWHMAVGRETLAARQIPLVDAYSYTMAGEPYPSYQMFWFMEVAIYAVYRLGGGELVVFIHSLLITGAYVIILWLCYQMSRSWRIAAFSTLFAAALGLNDWNVRPQTITFLLGAMILLAINRLQTDKRKVWLVVIFLGMVVWVNSHGTFPIGLALVGAWWLEEAWSTFSQKGDWMKRLYLPTVAGLVGGLACLVNPQGLGIVSYVRTLTGSPLIQNLVPEWAAPSFETLGGTIFLVGLIVLTCVLILSPRRPSPSQFILFLLFSILGLKTMRGVIWFGIVMAPVLADHVKTLVSSLVPEKPEIVVDARARRVNRLFLGVLLLMVLISLPWFKRYLPLPPLKAGIFSFETPTEATEFLLAEQFPTPLFHAMSFGSYLIWEAQPDYPVFVDSRIELFSAEIWRDYILASGGDSEWQEILDRYGIKTVMAGPGEQSGLIEVLSNSPAWTIVYQDHAALIFTRK